MTGVQRVPRRGARLARWGAAALLVASLTLAGCGTRTPAGTGTATPPGASTATTTAPSPAPSDDVPAEASPTGGPATPPGDAAPAVDLAELDAAVASADALAAQVEQDLAEDQ